MPPAEPVRANLLGHAITLDPKLERWDILSSNAPLLGVSGRAPDGVENVMIFPYRGSLDDDLQRGTGEPASSAGHLCLICSRGNWVVLSNCPARNGWRANAARPSFGGRQTSG